MSISSPVDKSNNKKAFNSNVSVALTKLCAEQSTVILTGSFPLFLCNVCIQLVCGPLCFAVFCSRF